MLVTLGTKRVNVAKAGTLAPGGDTLNKMSIASGSWGGDMTEQIRNGLKQISLFQDGP